jgi:hypothetical protein
MLMFSIIIMNKRILFDCILFIIFNVYIYNPVSALISGFLEYLDSQFSKCEFTTETNNKTIVKFVNHCLGV